MTGAQKQRRDNLLVVCAGSKSLHYEWIEADRNYDIFVLNYSAEKLRSCGEEFVMQRKGYKWDLINAAMSDNQFIQNYQYLAFFDDDVRFTRGGLNQLFMLGSQLDLDIFQPSIDPVQGYQTLWWHLWQAADSDYRMTNLIEIMAPVVTPEIFLKSKPVLENNPLGWGLDSSFWPTIMHESGGKIRAAVIDQVVIEHTREQFGNYDILQAAVNEYKMMERIGLTEHPSFIHLNTYHPDLEVSEPCKF